jgi:hypothetical protein
MTMRIERTRPTAFLPRSTRAATRIAIALLVPTLALAGCKPDVRGSSTRKFGEWWSGDFAKVDREGTLTVHVGETSPGRLVIAFDGGSVLGRAHCSFAGKLRDRMAEVDAGQTCDVDIDGAPHRLTLQPGALIQVDHSGRYGWLDGRIEARGGSAGAPSGFRSYKLVFGTVTSRPPKTYDYR